MDDLASSSSSVPTKNSKWWTYDVFLSFRGEDTRRNFTDHLYYALKDAGIYTFKDDFDLPRGETLTPELTSAIRKSKICVVVFSKNYAVSKWCLEELAEIISCKKTLPQLLLPVFYDIEPTEVRKQLNSFAEAFTKHEQEFAANKAKVDTWREALKKAGSISGWDLKSVADGHEAKFIREIIVPDIRKRVKTDLDVAIHPVGVEARVGKLSSWMSAGSDDKTCFFGICGMGGSGKTTLSKALYNRYSISFEGQCFIANVREESNKNGLSRLQKQLLSKVLKTNVEIHNEAEGCNTMKQRLCRKRVFLVLDDIDHRDQINALARNRDWFGSGSRIIVNTRDEDLLNALEMDEVYRADENLLDNDESLQLFSLHAFKAPKPSHEFIEYSKKVVEYCQKLPLALEVLGSYLHNCKNMDTWEGTMEKLKVIPHGDINKKLKISYDALEDDTQRKNFLDVCCFCLGRQKDLVEKFLDGCGFFGKYGLRVLVSRCLVKIDDKGCLVMHDLLRDMGREIVRQESPDEPGKRTRLWLQEEVEEVLTNNTGTENIEGLILNHPPVTDFRRYIKREINQDKFNVEAFVKMRKLRFLCLKYVQFNGIFKYLNSKRLRWISWPGFPLKVVPDNLYLGNLVVIEMQESKLKEVWKGTRCLENLKILDLSRSMMLTRFSDFSKLPNLEELRLSDCRSLSELDESIGQLHKLQLIDLNRCKSYKCRPVPNNLKATKTLYRITQIPSSISQCEEMGELYSHRRYPNPLAFLPPSLQGLRSLEILNLEFCNLTDNDIPKDFGSLSSLEKLYVGGNPFQYFPADISGLSNLVLLNFCQCRTLKSVPELPKNLKHFSAKRCFSLESTPDLSKLKQPLQKLILMYCSQLVEVQGLLERLGGIVDLRFCWNLSSAFQMDLFKKWTEVDHGMILLSENGKLNIWQSLDFQSSSSSVCFRIPPVNQRIRGFDFVAIDSSRTFWGSKYRLKFKLSNKSNNHSRDFSFHLNESVVSRDKFVCLVKIGDLSTLQLETGDYVKVKVSTFRNRNSVEKLGCRIVYHNLEEDKFME